MEAILVNLITGFLALSVGVIAVLRIREQRNLRASVEAFQLSQQRLISAHQTVVSSHQGFMNRIDQLEGILPALRAATENALPNYPRLVKFPNRGFFSVGTSSAHFLRYLVATRELSGEDNFGFYDLDPDFHRIYEALPETHRRAFYSRSGPMGAGKVPLFGKYMFLAAQEKLEQRLAPSQVNFFFVNACGGTGGGVGPEIVRLMPPQSINIALLNASCEMDRDKLCNFAYSFPLFNNFNNYIDSAEPLSGGNAPSVKANMALESSYSWIVPVDPGAIVEKLDLGTTSLDAGRSQRLHQYLEHLGRSINGRLIWTPENERTKEFYDHRVASYEYLRRIQELLSASEVNISDFRTALRSFLAYQWKRFLVPYLWPISDDWEEVNPATGKSEIPAMLDKAMDYGQLCRETKPEEAGAAFVFIEGPSQFLLNCEDVVKVTMSKKYGLDPTMVKVYPIPSDGENAARLLVLLWGVTFAPLPALAQLSKETVRDVSLAWRRAMVEFPAHAAMVGASSEESTRLQQAAFAEIDTWYERYTKWWRLHRDHVEQIVGPRSAEKAPPPHPGEQATPIQAEGSGATP